MLVYYWVLHEISVIFLIVGMVLWMKKNPFVHHYEVGLVLLIYAIIYGFIVIVFLDKHFWGLLLVANAFTAGMLNILVDRKDLFERLVHKIPIAPRRSY